MTTTDGSHVNATPMTDPGIVDLKLEVVTLPVADVDLAKRFYSGLGWRLDADIAGDGFRVVQLTPPHSPCSVHFGTGLTKAEPGSAKRLLLAVADIAAARSDLISRGAPVGEIYHVAAGPVPGADPEHGSYQSYATFSDPDGNEWLLQEITTRLPGRLWADTTADIASRADLLHETSSRHDPYEKSHAPHNWWDWYSAYMGAREAGMTPDEASAAAGRYMDEVLHVPAQ